MARFADSAVSAASVATASARLRSDTSTAVARAVTDMVARKSCDSSKARLAPRSSTGRNPSASPTSRTSTAGRWRRPSRAARIETPPTAATAGRGNPGGSCQTSTSARRRRPRRGRERPGGSGLDELLTSPLKGPVPRPEHDEGREDEIAGGIAQPPGQPDGPELRPRNVPAECQAREPDGGADGRARQGGEPHEREDVARAIEHRRAIRQAADEVRPHQRLQRIARRDPQRRPYRPRRGDVRHGTLQRRWPARHGRPAPGTRRRRCRSGATPAWRWARSRPEAVRSWPRRNTGRPVQRRSRS